MEYINVNERLPLIGQIVLIFYAWLEGPGFDIGTWNGSEWKTKSKIDFKEYKGGTCNVIFWAHLKEPEYTISTYPSDMHNIEINGMIKK